MPVVTSLLLVIAGIGARFGVAAEVAGFKMHAIGVVLIAAGVAGVIVSFVRLARGEEAQALTGCTVAIDTATTLACWSASAPAGSDAPDPGIT